MDEDLVMTEFDKTNAVAPREKLQISIVHLSANQQRVNVIVNILKGKS